MSMFRKSGSTGVISETGFDIKSWDGKNGKDGYRTVSFNFKFRPDGADEAVSRFIPAGFVYEGTEVSKDGTTLENAEEGGILQDNTEFSRFIGSMVEAGYPEASLPEDGRNFSCLEGYRVTLTQWKDEEATKKFGQRKGKDGKAYDRTETRVAKVIGREEVKAAAGAKKTTATKPANGAKSAVDIERADEVLKLILGAAKDNTISRGKLKSAFLKYALGANSLVQKDERTAFQDLIASEAYLVGAMGRDVVTYDGEAKDQPISLM